MSNDKNKQEENEVLEEEQPYPVQQSVAFAGTTFVTMGMIDLLAHLGPTGLVLAGMAALVAYRHGPEVASQVRGIFPSPIPSDEENQEQGKPQKLVPNPGARSVLDWAIG